MSSTCSNTPASNDPWPIGLRIRSVDSDRSKGTVRYSGQVDDRDGEWIGIEWDDPSRGRHDGVVDGRRYFSCRIDGGSGSFVRAKRCSRSKSFLQAVKERYVHRLEDDERFLIGKNSDTANEFKIPIEFIGEEQVATQISKIDELQCISLKSMDIATVEEAAGDLCRDVREIDLEDNLIVDWEQVANLPRRLSELRLGKNRLEPVIPPQLIPRLAATTSTLQTLMLNSVPDAWPIVCGLGKNGCIPSLRELYLGDNALETLSGDCLASSFPNLSLIDLTGNDLHTWASISCLGRLPRLSTLILDRNAIDVIGPIGDDQFRQLQFLSLFDNKIASLESLNALKALPSLTSLRTANNPFDDVLGCRRVRSLLIGYLPLLATLNRSAVTPRERMDSEIAFLRFCESDPPNTFSLSQRHHDLRAQFKDVAIESTPSTTTATTGASSALSLRLRSNLPASMTMAPVVRVVPSSMTTATMAQLCRRVFRIDRSVDVDLYVVDVDGAFPAVMDDWTRPLEYYAMRSGSEIIIESKR